MAGFDPAISTTISLIACIKHKE